MVTSAAEAPMNADVLIEVVALVGVATGVLESCGTVEVRFIMGSVGRLLLTDATADDERAPWSPSWIVAEETCAVDDAADAEDEGVGGPDRETVAVDCGIEDGPPALVVAGMATGQVVSAPLVYDVC